MFAVALIVVVAVEGLFLLTVLRRWRATNRAAPVRLRKEATVGTLVWLRGSPHGRLDGIARFEYQALVPRRLWDLVRWGIGRSGWHRRHRRMPAGVVKPSGDFADDVAAEANRRLDKPWLLNHSKRTYVIAALYGAKRGYAFDEELLWAACMLHATGLGAPPPGRSPGIGVDECYSIRSADIAASVAVAHGRSSEWIDRLREAILLHPNPAVSKSLGIEAWLLHVANAIDITGLGYHRVYSEAIDRVYLQCPLLDQQTAVLDTLANEANHNRSCRAAALGRIGVGRLRVLPWLIATSPIYDLYHLNAPSSSPSPAQPPSPESPATPPLPESPASPDSPPLPPGPPSR